MSIQQNKLFSLISTTEISFLKDLDKKILISKKGKFYYESFLELSNDNISRFLLELDDTKVYTLIPFISINNRSDEPYLILSQQILVTSYSNSLNITNYISRKIEQSFYLFNIDELQTFNIIIKYKQIEFNFKKYNNFI